MIRYFLILMVFSSLLYSCDDDDICIEQTTPDLIVSLQKVSKATIMDSIIIYRENKAGKFDLITSVANNDTIGLTTVKIPMPVDERNQVQFIVGKRRFDSKYQDTLTVNYEYNLRFISKACGFGVNYLNTQYNLSTKNYFNTLITLKDEITSEDSPHIRLNY